MKSFTVTEDDFIDAVRDAWSAGYMKGRESSPHEKDDGWQPRDTAPKDGQNIDVWGYIVGNADIKPFRITNVYYSKDKHPHYDPMDTSSAYEPGGLYHEEGFWLGEDFENTKSGFIITHWRYPPDPPNN